MPGYDAGEAYVRFTGNFSGLIESVSAEARRDADAYARVFQEQLRRNSPNVHVQVDADTARARAQLAALDTNASRSLNNTTKQSHLLRDAIIALGPAAVPVASVLVGAFVGTLPVLASVALGVKGISDEWKSGQLQGTKYAGDIRTLQGELHKLETISAGGLLAGLDTATAGLRPAFVGLNQDTALMSRQFGQIAGHVIPGLVSLLHQLDPLFVTIGNDLLKGATAFEHWAKSSTAVSGFVTYVQQELPVVEHTIGQLVISFAHLAQGLAPMGHLVLTSLGLLAQTLNALPIDVLTKIETGAIAVYAAFRTYSGITAIVNSVNAAMATFAARQAASATVASASALEVQSAAAAEAAAFAAAQADMAAAAAESAVAIAAAVEGTSSVLVAGATAAAEAAIEESAAFAAAAEAAAASAAEIAAAAEAAAAASVVAGEEASLGWAAMLGPIGALVVGLGVLGFALSSSDSATTAAADSMRTYADSVKQSVEALAQVNVAQTTKNLSDAGALNALQQLHSQNIALGTSYRDLAKAINGPKAGFDQLRDSLKKTFQSEAVQNGPDKTRNSLYTLLSALDDNRAGLFKQIAVQKAYNAALRENQQAADGGSASALREAHALGLTKTGYLDAQVAAKKNTASTRQQTIAWQLANSAGNLLQQTLDKLSGKKQSYAQADNAFEQQLVSMAQNLKNGSKAIQGLSSDAIANRGDLLSLVQGAQTTAEAYGQMTGSTDKARQKLIDLRKQIIDNAVAHGEDRKAVTNYIDSLLKIPARVPPTVIDVIDNASGPLKRIKLAEDALQNKQITITQYENLVNITGPGGSADSNRRPGQSGTRGNAAGTGPGGLGDGYFTMNEAGWELGHKQGSRVDIWSHQDSMRRTGLPDKLPGFAGGTKPPKDVVTLSPSGSSSSSSASSSSSPSSSSTAAFTAESKAAQKAKQELQAATQAMQSFAQVVGLTPNPIIAAETAFLSAARAAGATVKDVTALQHTTDRLASKYRDLTEVQTRLGSAPSALSAYDKLANRQQQLNDEFSSVRSAILGSFDITGAGVTAAKAASTRTVATPIGGVGGGSVLTTVNVPKTPQSVTAKVILDQITKTANQASRFGHLLRELKKDGLPDALLEQLAAAGPQALPQARALAQATPKQFREIKAEYGQLRQSSTQIGHFISNDLYKAGVDAAQGLVNGLKSQEKALEKEMRKLADTMTHRFKHDMKIHSPSQVFHELGSFTGQGLVNGIVQEVPNVRAAVGQLTQAHMFAHDLANRVNSGKLAATGGVTQNIYPQPHQSETEIGQIAANRILFAVAGAGG